MKHMDLLSVFDSLSPQAYPNADCLLGQQGARVTLSSAGCWMCLTCVSEVMKDLLGSAEPQRDKSLEGISGSTTSGCYILELRSATA